MIASCGKKDATGYKSGIVTGNWVVNGGIFNVRLDNDKIVKDTLSFSEHSDTANGLYTHVGAGLHQLGIYSGNKTIVSNTVSLVAGNNYSLFMYDTLQNDHVKVLLLKDQLLPVDTVVKARFIQLIPNPDTLSLVLIKDRTGYVVSDVYQGKKAAAGSIDFFMTLPPGTYEVSLVRKATVIAQPFLFVLQAGKIYSFISKGVISGTGIYREGVQVLKHN